MIPELPGGYHFDSRGFVREADEQVIANFFLTPTRAYRFEGDTLPSFCDIAVVREGGYIPFQNRMELSKLTAAWWKAPPPGCFYTPGVKAPHRQMEALFQMLLGKLEPITVLQPTVLGWEMPPSGGEHIYVTGGGAIGVDGYLPEDQVWIPAELEQYRLETLDSASEVEVSQYFWDLYRAVPGISDILLANTFAAILFPCFKEAGVESRFPIILEGPSEAKKTTLSCLTGCLYNRKSNLRGSIATLTSTSRALEKRGVELRHAVVVFDDLFPDGGSALEQKVLALVRNIANQNPRQFRLGKALVGSAMECGAVVTAETFPNCGRSTRTRCLRLPIGEPIPNSVLLPLQKQPELLGNVFQTFIMGIAGNYMNITQEIEEDFRGYRQRRAEDNPVSSERLYEIGFVLYTALKIYFSQSYGSDSSEIEEELSLFNERLNMLIGWQLSPQAAPGRGWLLSATAELAKRRPNEFFRRSGHVCIKPGRLCYLLQEHYSDKTINVPEIIRQLRGEQLLDMDKSGVATKKIKGLGRCLCIDAQKLLR